MKEILYAGDSLDEEVEIVDPTGTEYTGDDGWAAKYVFIPRDSTAGTKFEIGCSWTGDAYRYQATSATSGQWQPADYTWHLVVTKTGLQVTAATGAAKVLDNPLTASVFDGRSQAEKALDDALAALATFQASGGKVKSYSIAGRSMEFETESGLRQQVSFWSARVASERRQRAIDSGLGDPFRAYVRM